MSLTPRLYKKILLLLFVAAAGTAKATGTATVTIPGLSHVTVQVNGESLAIRAGDQLDLIAGDILRLKGAALGTSPSRPLRVSLNFIGVPGRDPVRLWDDIDQDINTATDVIAAHAISRAENKYLVRAEVSGTTIGVVYVRISPPRLAFAEILVNGQVRVLRDGETLRIAPSDQVKLNRFESNISNPAEVGFRFLQSTGSGAFAKGGLKTPYEFVFSRGGRVFARIPVRVESLSRENDPGEPKG
jgi:hypothetical protein